MHRIAPCIWFDTNALEAAEFYVSAFENSKVEAWSQYVEGDGWPSPLPPGAPLNVRFTLCGQEFNAVNGGPIFRPTPAISFYVDCETETQLDALWKKLSSGGFVLMELGGYPFSKKFGWLADRYGVNWQLSLTGEKQHISPYFLFTQDAYSRAEEAMKSWCGTFEDAAIVELNLYDRDAAEAAGEREGTVMFASFRLEGQPFMAADSGYDHLFTFTEGVSLMVYCASQSEIDALWARLTEGGAEQPCGWLKDRFGVSWQIVPGEMEKLMDTSEPARAKRVSAALLRMKKIDLQVLRDAWEGRKH